VSASARRELAVRKCIVAMRIKRERVKASAIDPQAVVMSRKRLMAALAKLANSR